MDVSAMRELRERRVLAGVPGSLLCRHANIGRTRLSNLEVGYADATPDEYARLVLALDSLIRGKEAAQAAAAAYGWPMTGVLGNRAS